MRRSVGGNGLKSIAGFRKYENLILWLLIVGFGIVYVSLCFNDNIWTDEGFTIDLLRNCDTYAQVCSFTAADVHPPLYYLILKVFTDLFGINLLLIKLLSIVPMLLTMMLAPLVMNKEFGFRIALFFILILGTLPCTMEYAIQARMYTWALLFVTLCGLFAFRAASSDHAVNWIFYLIGGVGAAYTHYFAFVAVLWIYGFLFLYLIFWRRKGVLRWLVTSVASLLAYLPWLSQMAIQVKGVSGSYWIAPIDGKVLRSYFPWIVKTDLPYVTAVFCVVFLIAFVLLGYQLVHRKKLDGSLTAALFGVVIPLLVVVTGVVLSKLIRPIFIIRYIMPSVGILSLFLAISFSFLETKAWISVGLFWLGMGTVDYGTNYKAEYLATYTKQTMDFLEEHLGDNDLVVYNYYGYDFIYEYYVSREQLVYIGDVDLGGSFDTIWFLDTPLNQEFSADGLAAYGLQSIEMGQYGIEQNEFKIYQISR